MPRDASPRAMSLNGLFGPSVASRSPDPEPCTRITEGYGPAPTGIVSVPGSAHSGPPMVSSSSVYAAGSAYDGGEYGAAAAGAGRNARPVIFPTESMPTTT